MSSALATRDSVTRIRKYVFHSRTNCRWAALAALSVSDSRLTARAKAAAASARLIIEVAIVA